MVVVMGVCGSGKSTVGRLLAERLGVEFLEGDDWHPPGNVARMAAGVPLSDSDRQDWLRALATALRQAQAAGRPLVLSCSALKRDYRERLREGCASLRFVHLQGEHGLFAQRMASRTDHYMPASLLDSQFAILEPPGADERAITLDAALPAQRIVDAVVAQLDQRAAGGTDHDRPLPA
jgi:gluconokinase